MNNNNDLVIYRRPKGSTAEAIRTLRTNLQFSLIDNSKVIMVTSSIPGEGKSFVSANLAAAFSMVDKKVLLIDCDLRKGRQSKVFGIKGEKGLSILLLEDVKNYKKYIYKTNIENLFVLPNGIVPPNPSELLGSDKMKILMDELKKDYDIIILDSPPVSAVADALVLTNITDKIIIVCAHNKTPIDLLSDTKKSLESVNNKIAGVVINKIKRESGSKYYYYSSNGYYE